jgi:toxin YoeB
MLRRINRLITEAARTPGFGIGKPAALKGDLSGYWSSRIDHVSTVERDVLIVVQCRHHY